MAQQQLTDTIAYTSTTQFPEETDPNNGNKWILDDSSHWTSGFFPGWIWLIYEGTLNDSWLTRAQAQTASMQAQDTNASTHDIGFKMLGSFGNEYRITRDPAALSTLLTAAQSMSSLYSPTAGVFNSWPYYDPTHLTVIIDNMMNLELPFLATQNGGSQSWYNMAVSHALKTMQNNVRPDGSTFQVVQYNFDGSVYDKLTAQGAGTNTTWSRGQAWGIYGFTMAYRYTKDSRFLATAQQLADYFINNLPPDFVPYWDFSQTGTAPRDSSAAAIAAAGLLELSTYASLPADQARYRTAALNIQTSLSSSAYLGVRGQTSGILLHGTANYPAGDYDKSLIYGDYYFIQSCYRALPLPTAPANLSATAGSSNQVNLAWDTESGAIRYTVKRSTTSGGPYTIVAPPPLLTTSSYTDSSVAAGSANYYYVVSATNVAGESPNSAEVLVPANNPLPSISSIAPTNAPAGANVTLTVNGTNFVQNSVANLNGKAQRTTFVSSTQLNVAVAAGDLAAGSADTITVVNAAPGGGTSGAVSFTVNDFSLSAPSSAGVKFGGSTAITITVAPSNANGFANPVAFSISGLPANVTASFSPTSVTPGNGSAQTTLTLAAAANSQVMLRTPLWPGLRLSLLWMGLALSAIFCGFSAIRRTSHVRLKVAGCYVALAVALLAGIVVSGCGSGSKGTAPPAPTPQAYTVTVTGQSGSDTKTAALNLTVGAS